MAASSVVVDRLPSLMYNYVKGGVFLAYIVFAFVFIFFFYLIVGFIIWSIIRFFVGRK